MVHHNTRKKMTPAEDTILRAAVKLIRGKRLEVTDKVGKSIYLGSSTANRRDPFWVEHAGGRTYYEKPESAVRWLLPHVGTAAIERARIFDDKDVVFSSDDPRIALSPKKQESFDEYVERRGGVPEYEFEGNSPSLPPGSRRG